MRINNNGKKRYYIYQNDEYVGKVTKKKTELSVNNNSPFYIRKSNKILEIAFYVCIGILTVVFAIFARPLLLILFMMGAFIINPFDLSRKTDYYIPRPTGTISLTDDDNFKTSAEVILRKRGQFLLIRFIFLMLFLNTIWLVITEFYFSDEAVPIAFWIGIAGYGVVYIWLMIFSIIKFKQNWKNYKLEKIEQDKVIAKV